MTHQLYLFIQVFVVVVVVVVVAQIQNEQKKKVDGSILMNVLSVCLNNFCTVLQSLNQHLPKTWWRLRLP